MRTRYSSGFSLPFIISFFVTGRIYYLNNLTPEAKQEKKEADGWDPSIVIAGGNTNMT